MMAELVAILITAGVSIPTGYVLHMLNGDRQHRAEAWKGWNSVNQTLRVQDVPTETLQYELGNAEWVLRYGHVPEELRRALSESALMYWRYWRVFPHGSPAPENVYAVHQETVDELRLILLHPLKDRLRRRPDYAAHLKRVKEINRSFEETLTRLVELAARPDMTPRSIDPATGRVSQAFADDVMRLSTERSPESSPSDADNPK